MVKSQCQSTSKTSPINPQALLVLQLVMPLQEARCLVEGYADGMWMDFWVLPMIIEAERGNSLPAWLKEYNKEGTYNLPLKTLIGANPFPSATESSGGGGLSGEA